MKKLFFLTAFALATAMGYAGGYRVSLQGQRALAMATQGLQL